MVHNIVNMAETGYINPVKLENRLEEIFGKRIAVKVTCILISIVSTANAPESVKMTVSISMQNAQSTRYIVNTHVLRIRC